MAATAHMVENIRAASRSLVRELGFMGGAFAGTDLSPSAVHALLEIEKGGATARDLGVRLHLEKSSVSRMLRKLVQSGDIREEPGADGRVKILALTESGAARVAAIHTYARAQVRESLNLLKPGQDATVMQGMRLYANVLAERNGHQLSAPSPVIECGYSVGLIASITEMHAVYYARESGFGLHFESVVAAGLAEFCKRLACPNNQIWVARLAGDIVGSIAVDGEDLGNNWAHLRWFILADEARGQGIGTMLLDAALTFADTQGFAETHLWTFSGLNAARHLYEKRGFVMTEEYTGDQWGTQVQEQRFVRCRPYIA